MFAVASPARFRAWQGRGAAGGVHVGRGLVGLVGLGGPLPVVLIL